MELNQAFFRDSFSPTELDLVLAQGWRHFGNYFFRYSSLPSGLQIQPLRMRLADFVMNRSQRRAWQRNLDLHIEVKTAQILPEYQHLFELHKTRFTENIPDQLEGFLGYEPESIPCDTRVICVSNEQDLLAAHFIDVGENSLSSVYSVYNPNHAERSLGTLTILLAIQYAQNSGKRWYYPGYATKEPSHYDYKKRFAALEYFDWLVWKSLTTTKPVAS